MAKNDLVQLRCNVMEKERWQQTASENGMELSPWIRWVLNREVGRPQQQSTIEQLFPAPGEEDDWEGPI